MVINGYGYFLVNVFPLLEWDRWWGWYSPRALQDEHSEAPQVWHSGLPFAIESSTRQG